MIAHGTGIAPMISILNRLINRLEKGEASMIGNVTLFYGVRDDGDEYLYREKIESSI